MTDYITTRNSIPTYPRQSGKNAALSRYLPNVIGIGGRLRAGKDTVADFLVSNFGYTKIGMSDPLLNALLTLDPLVPINARPNAHGGLYGEVVGVKKLVAEVGYTKAKENPWVRELLQRLGTEVGRKMISESVWTDMARREIERVIGDGGRIVVTGIRFENEVEMIRTFGGGILLWVERNKAREEATDYQSAHASESIDSGLFDVGITNDGTLDELFLQVSDAIRSHAVAYDDTARKEERRRAYEDAFGPDDEGGVMVVADIADPTAPTVAELNSGVVIPVSHHGFTYSPPSLEDFAFEDVERLHAARVREGLLAPRSF